MAKSPKYVHVTVVNRDPRGSKPLKLETAKGAVEIAPGRSETAVMGFEPFKALHAQQRDAVQRKPGVLRLIDFWSQNEAGERSPVEV